MIRIVGVVVVCSLGLTAIVAKAGTAASRPPHVETYLDQTTVVSGVPQDTLTEADKLETGYVREAIEAEPAAPTARVLNETPPQPPRPPATRKIVTQHSHDPNTKKVTVASPGRGIKGQESKKSKKVEQAKPLPVDLRPCRRPEGFAGLLRALNLSPGCDT